jgi:protein TonB
MEGTVVVRALIAADGHVKDTQAIPSIPILDAAAQAAVRKWTFKPAMRDGKPVETWMNIPIKFSLH